MATDQELNELLQRLITDSAFRDELMADPRGTAEKAGYDLTSEQLSQLETLETDELTGAVDERVSKMVLPMGYMRRKQGPFSGPRADGALGEMIDT